MKSQKTTSQNRVLRHSMNYRMDAHDLEHPTGISMTHPDSTPDLRTLIQRNDSGILISQRQDGYSDEDYPDLQFMDRIGIITLRKQLAQEREDLEAEIHAANKTLEEQERKIMQENLAEQNKKLLELQKELELERRHKPL